MNCLIMVGATSADKNDAKNDAADKTKNQLPWQQEPSTSPLKIAALKTGGSIIAERPRQQR